MKAGGFLRCIRVYLRSSAVPFSFFSASWRFNSCFPFVSFVSLVVQLFFPDFLGVPGGSALPIHDPRLTIHVSL